VAEIKKGKYIYYHCTGYRGKCPELYVRQEALEDHFVGLLRRLRSSEQDFQPVRQAIANASAEDSRIQPISTFRDKAYLAGKPGALAQDGAALLDMGRTANLGLAGLSSEMKRQVLQLLLANF
jgi:hypothetical protein